MEIKEYKKAEEKLYINDLKYWCNGCGELHHFGEFDITEDDLPKDLQRAYNELWTDGTRSYCYLVTYQDKNYIALINGYDADCADVLSVSMDELYDFGKKIAEKVAVSKIFENAQIVFAEMMNFNDAHELIVLIDPYESKENFVKMAKYLEENAYKMN